MHFSWGWGLVSPPPLKKKPVSFPPNTNYPNLPTKFPQTPPKKWEEAATHATQAKGNHREYGGLQPRFSPELSPKVWPGWPKIPKSYWEARPKENYRENGGGSSAQIFPQTSPQRSLEKKQKFPSFFPKIFGESSGVKSWLKTPIFPMVSFGGDQVPKFYLDDLPPRPSKFGDLVRVPLGPKFPKSIGRRRPPRPKVTIGKLGGGGCFSPDFPPKKFWQQRKCWLENPQSSLWWGELWWNLGWKPPCPL